MWLNALDQWSVFAVDSATALFRRALAADPDFFPAFADQLQLATYMGTTVQLREEYARRTDLPPAAQQCMHLLLRMHDADVPDFIPAFRQLRDRHGRSSCIAFGLARALTIMPALTGEALTAARSVAAEFPEHPGAVELYGDVVRRVAPPDARRAAVTHVGTLAPAHMLTRIRFDALRAADLRARGDSVAVQRIVLDLERAVERDGRPFVRYSFHERFAVFRPQHGGPEAGARRLIAIATAARMPAVAARASVELSGWLVEVGRIQDALRLLAPHVAFVHRHQLYAHQVRLALTQGRALARAGRGAEAIHALDRALDAATRIASAHYAAEVHHQRLHAFEGQGRWREAALAARDYIAFAHRTVQPGPRVMSYRDAADIHWKAGWHAAADSLSRRMVATIEREGVHHAYAAEYFERAGDFGRALTYFRRAAAPDATGHVRDAKVTYAGLTRMHLALGNRDSALAAARRHDSLQTTYDEVLTPRALLAFGRTREAVEVMREWANLQADRGNLRGQVKAVLALATALVEPAPAEAMNVAAQAASLSKANEFLLEQIAALRAGGEAATRLGHGDAIGLLTRARTLARDHPDAMERILVEIALGEALAGRARHAEALGAFAVAVELVERSGRTIHDDVSSARYRSARGRAFNGALRSTLATRGVADVLHWSARKKAPWSAGHRARDARIAALRGRLADNEVLIDFVVVDTLIAASVVTRANVSLHRLPLSATAARALATTLLRPLTAVHAGRIDLARAPFDHDAARRLYDGLLRPLERALNGATRVVISPDAPLHGVPFDALVESSRGEPDRYVLDRWAVAYALAPVAGARGRAVRATDSLLVVGADAPGTADEQRLIRAAWPGPVRMLAGVDATEANLARAAPVASILHVASHARSSERDPLASYLALRPDATHDGMLHYAEIEAARNQYGLVVLNACETSAGELLEGSGFMSLARAYLVGGSAAVIGTQWPIGPASALLAERLYVALRRGARVEDALRQAKLDVRGRSGTAHPFFWASHVLIRF